MNYTGRKNRNQRQRLSSAFTNFSHFGSSRIFHIDPKTQILMAAAEESRREKRKERKRTERAMKRSLIGAPVPMQPKNRRFPRVDNHRSEQAVQLS